MAEDENGELTWKKKDGAENSPMNREETRFTDTQGTDEAPGKPTSSQDKETKSNTHEKEKATHEEATHEEATHQEEVTHGTETEKPQKGTEDAKSVNEVRERKKGTGEKQLYLINTSENVFSDCTPLQKKLWRAWGLAFASMNAAAYYLILVVPITFTIWIIMSRCSFASLAATISYIALAYTPVKFHRTLLFSKFYAAVGLAFDAEAYSEIQTVEEFNNHPKPVLVLMVPHGVISYGGWAFGTLYPMKTSVLAVADALLRTPVIRQIFSTFNCVSGSRHVLKHILKDRQQNVALYPGGLAELFLSSSRAEQIYFRNRKGCIKLALESGADVCIIYFYGNNHTWKIWKPRLALRLSRIFKASLTFFRGRFYLPIPLYTPLIGVMGEIIELPDMSADPSKITPEILDHQHARVTSDIQRLFDSYKHLHPILKDQKLDIL